MNRFRARKINTIGCNRCCGVVSHVDIELLFEIYVHRIELAVVYLENQHLFTLRGKLAMIEKFIKQQMVELEIPTTY